MLDSSATTCSAVTGMSSSISCTYSQSSRFLTVINPVSSATSGSSLTFSVYPFLNPYNGIKKTSFKITSFDSSGYEIDKIDNLSV